MRGSVGSLASWVLGGWWSVGLPLALSAQVAPVSGGQSSSPPDGIRDILPPVDIPYWTTGRSVGLVTLGLMMMALMLMGMVWGVRKMRPQIPPPSPTQIALEALRALKGSDATGLSTRDFAAKVADILRRFLEMAYGMDAPRQTTDEFLEAIKNSPRFADADRERLKEFLRQCDRCKFAGVEVEGDARRDLVGAAETQVIGGGQ